MIKTEQLLVVEQTVNALIDQHYALLDIGFPEITAMQVTRAFLDTFGERCVKLGMTHELFLRTVINVWTSRVRAMYPGNAETADRVIAQFMATAN
jgi:hypothetical protein